jgi:ribosomal protein L25 (general stress protein Ctc)
MLLKPNKRLRVKGKVVGVYYSKKGASLCIKISDNNSFELSIPKDVAARYANQEVTIDIRPAGSS